MDTNDKHTPGLWRTIDAEGGTPTDVFSDGYCAAIDVATDRLEEAGITEGSAGIADVLKAENERLKDINAELVEALEAAQTTLDKFETRLTSIGAIVPEHLVSSFAQVQSAIAKAKAQP